MLDICVVGLGALGTVYALSLESSGLARVTAVCRSNRKILDDHGIDIVSDTFGTHRLWKPYRAVSAPAEAADRRYRFIICTFKALPDVVSIPDLLGPLLDKTDAFVLIQNGICVEAGLQKCLPDAIIISGCAWVDATVIDNGHKVTQYGNVRFTLTTLCVCVCIHTPHFSLDRNI